MADRPADPATGSYRVVRSLRSVTETVVAAASVTAALSAAAALPPEAWSTRLVLQKDGQDPFEYDTVAPLSGGASLNTLTMASATPVAARSAPGTTVSALNGLSAGSTRKVLYNTAGGEDRAFALNTAGDTLVVGLALPVLAGTYPVTVRETASDGVTTKDTTLNVSVSATTVPTLPATGLVAAYEMDSVVQGTNGITQFTDKSGAGNHATQADTAGLCPALMTIDGIPRARFASGNRMSIPTGVAVSNANMGIFAVAAVAQNTSSIGLVSMGAAGTGYLYINTAKVVFKDSANHTFTGQPKSENETLFGAVAGKTSGNVELIQAAETASLALGTQANLTGGIIGDYTDSTHQYLVGDIIAVYAYNTATMDEAGLRAYVQAKYGCGFASGDTPIALFTDGDSQTQGYDANIGATSPTVNIGTRPIDYAARKMKKVPPVRNLGASGNTIQQRTTAATQAASSTNGLDAYMATFTSASAKYLVLDMGTNSLAASNTTTGTEVFGYMDTYLKARRDSGGWDMTKVGIILPRPRNTGNNASYEQARQDYITALKASQWASLIIPGQVPDGAGDLGHVMWTEALPNTTAAQPFYNANDIHMNDLGRRVTGSLIKAWLAGLGVL